MKLNGHIIVTKNTGALQKELGISKEAAEEIAGKRVPLSQFSELVIQPRSLRSYCNPTHHDHVL